MQLKIEQCQGTCGKVRPIVNRKYMLCESCNKDRLGTTKVVEEVKKSCSPIRKQQKRIKQLSAKQVHIKEKLKIVKSRVEQRDSHNCQGCELGYNLDKSHILSVGQRRDLELEIDNIQLLCRACHVKWESWDIVKMLELNCFENNMRYIESNDESTFWKMVYKLKEYLESQRTSQLVVGKIQTLYFYSHIKN